MPAMPPRRTTAELQPHRDFFVLGVEAAGAGCGVETGLA
jgi:hypothetical protein